MTHYLDWVDVVIIGWLAVSALVTPLVGRFLGAMFPDSRDDEVLSERDPISTKVPHDAADA